MSSLKKRIAINIFDLLKRKHINEKIDNLANCIFFVPVNKRKREIYNATINLDNLNDNEFNDLKNDGYLQNNLLDNYISYISKEESYLTIQLNKSKFVEGILSDIKSFNNIFGCNLICQNKHFKDLYGLKLLTQNSKIAVEYSSPNIAKPFHVGHLRSTIIGQFISNLLTSFNHHVLRINYLGDWGYQFASLAVGLKKYNLLDNLNEVTLQDLLEVYIKVNEAVANDPLLNADAKLFLLQLENGNKEALSIWKYCRDLSLQENAKIYKRLNVDFTYTHSESMYFNQINNSIKKLENRLYKESEDGSLYVDLTQENDKSKVYAVLKNSNATSLYLSRDVEAAMERINKLSTNKLLYIVENGQHLHFDHLSRILQILGINLGGEIHVKFGRLEGMSTRSGSFVPLNYLLDEAKRLAKEAIISKPTTKVGKRDADNCAEILGHSCILINDLKRRRINNYKFDWKEALNFNGNSGIFLQYTHARLNNLLNEYSLDFEKGFNYDLLTEEIALKLVQHLARYDEILVRCYFELEACHLVNYLFNLCQLVNVAYRDLYIQNQDTNLAKIRLLLFQCSRSVLFNGLTLLGITPLEKM